MKKYDTYLGTTCGLQAKLEESVLLPGLQIALEPKRPLLGNILRVRCTVGVGE